MPEEDLPAPAPEPDTPPPDGTTGALVTAVLALADTLEAEAPAGKAGDTPARRKLRAARQALADTAAEEPS